MRLGRGRNGGGGEGDLVQAGFAILGSGSEGWGEQEGEEDAELSGEHGFLRNRSGFQFDNPAWFSERRGW